jgi:hypothetical protein
MESLMRSDEGDIYEDRQYGDESGSGMEWIDENGSIEIVN